VSTPPQPSVNREAARANVLRAFLFFGLAVGLVVCGVGCSNKHREQVVIYTSQDQIYAEPILRQFTDETGIEVRPVFDSEAVKTVGLVNRLLAERHHPQCDVFWNNETLRTYQLAARDVFRQDNAWRPIGFRSRRIVINTNHVSISAAPQTLSALTNAALRSKVALAYPLFGTTATHFLALRQRWGDAAWKAWCRALQLNRPMVVDGNSVVVKLVGRGEAWVGLTDSDDIAAGIRDGLPVMAMPMTDESLLIPNTVAVIRGAPHPAAAERLFDYLQRADVLEKLVAVNALEGLLPSANSTATLAPDFTAMIRDLDLATTTLKEIFLR
jgi:iron(III) transport system substrate-binding protein